jgi:hypothetical protein
MARLAEQISQNEQQAAVTQQALRNNRRVVRHRSDTEDNTENASIVLRASTHVPFVIDTEAPTAKVAVSPPSGIETSPTAVTLSPLDLPAEQFKAGLDRRKQNRQLLMDWLRTALVDGSDFGRIHVVGKSHCRFASMGRMKESTEAAHWSKPVLFKSGAEKITGMLGMTVHYPSLPAYEAAVLASIDIKTVLLRCELRDAQGRAVAEAEQYEASLAEYEEYVGLDDVAALRERIRGFKFTEKRVLAWLFKTTQGTVTKLEQLTIDQCVSLLKKLEQWAEAEKTLANGQTKNND